MPSAITPRRRRREIESDNEGDNASQAPEAGSPQDSGSNKRARTGLNHDTSSTTQRSLLSNSHNDPSGTLQYEVLRSKPSVRSHQPGSIVRVKLSNFVTYTAVEFFPGPSLNMVIGPNGTGKSTLVCALCLGLGWGPQHLGRAKDISEYVKHGFQEAMIEIELAGDKKRTKGKNVVIRCNIKREGNKSIFSINEKPSTKKNVIDLARSLSIQIDNLCQFLPQDKVVEFAAMTPIELLKSTQRAVAPQAMIDMHNDLKELRQQQKELQAKQMSDQDTLANFEGRQRMQEADVERMREREQIKEKVRLMEAARPFPKYRAARNKHRETKERRKVAATDLKNLENEVEPSLRAVNAKQQYQHQIRVVLEERRQAVDKADRAANILGKKIDTLTDRGVEFEKEREAEINSGKQDRQMVTRTEQNIIRLKKQMEEDQPDLDISLYNELIRKKKGAIEGLKRKVIDLQRGQEDTTRLGRERKERIQYAERELSILQSQAGQQNKKLLRISSDTHKAWEWVKKNQHIFEKQVFGPPVVECSITDPRYTDMIETLFQKTQFLTFTTQTNGDFKTLQKHAHDELHLSEINIKVMNGGMDLFTPPVGKEELKQYGFQSWASEYIAGPEPVLAMLSSDIKLHRTAVSLQDTTSQQFERLQNSPIDSWLTSKSSYNIIRRREYGPSAVSTRVRDVKRATVWNDQPVDLTAKRELQENIEGWGEEFAAFQKKNEESQAEIQKLRDEIRNMEHDIQTMQEEKAAKQRILGEYKALPIKLTQQEQKMADAQQSISKMRQRIQVVEEQHDAVVMERGQVALDYASAVENLRQLHSSLHEAEIMLIEASSDLGILIERNSSVKEMLESKRREVDEIVRESEASSTEARRLLDVCKKLMTTEDEGLSAFLNTLPETQTSEEFEIEIESERARLELMHEGNGGVIREFEQRQKKIDGLKENLEDINHGLGELGERIKEIRDRWEPELDGLVRQISDSFSFNMKQINCAGEVGVFKDEDDFDQWAIQIRVKFRESEPLTTLDSHRQSGGERAVSTIFYLMSLQTLTRSPFRVVDEINQGMDPRNERLVHKRMVDIACGSDQSAALSTGDDDDDDDGGDGGEGHGKGRAGSQYFLITPKLLHGLEYARGMQVLCIASGEYMPAKRSTVDFQGCIDLARGLTAEGVNLGVDVHG